METDNTTHVTIAIFSKDPLGHGVGVTLSRRDKQGNFHPYCIMSLWLSKAEYKSQRKVLLALFPRIFEYIPDSDEIIRFRSTVEYFGHSIGQMERKAGVYAGGRQTLFFRLKNSPREALALAIDAAHRQTDIIEEL
jgi:hypothetical protein